jgi:hypothetical protein
LANVDTERVPPDDIEQLLAESGVEVTRETYISLNWFGQDIEDEWTPEHEAELPEHLQDWSLFVEQSDGTLVYTGDQDNEEEET